MAPLIKYFHVRMRHSNHMVQQCLHKHTVKVPAPGKIRDSIPNRSRNCAIISNDYRPAFAPAWNLSVVDNDGDRESNY